MNLQEEMKQFEDWWYEHNDPTENPYKNRAALTFWAWEAWQAGRKSKLQELNDLAEANGEEL